MKKIRITLKCFDHRVLGKAAASIRKKAEATGAIVRGPVPLKTKKNIFSARRSPHVNEDSQEQFEIRTHKRIIDIHLSSLPESTIEGLMKLDLPSSVGVQVDVPSKK